ncbi:MAG: hypothetical protein LAN83_00930 [Acidobacteriia bacterium]|nr:hypothetical protein [Terriglobia bacterium]
MHEDYQARLESLGFSDLEINAITWVLVRMGMAETGFKRDATALALHGIGMCGVLCTYCLNGDETGRTVN